MYTFIDLGDEREIKGEREEDWIMEGRRRGGLRKEERVEIGREERRGSERKGVGR